MHPIMQCIHRNRQSCKEAEERTEDFLELNRPNITVFTYPEPSDNPFNALIADINAFAEKELKVFDVSTTAGGIYAVTPPRRLTEYPIDRTEYWEINECGLVYYRKIWAEREKRDHKYLLSVDLIKYIVESIHKAGLFYDQCGYIGRIQITARLDQVSGKKLAYLEDTDKQSIERQECTTPDVFAYAGCLTQDLVDKEYLINTGDEIVFPLIQVFDGPIKQRKNDPARRKRIEQIVERRFW